MRLNRTPSRLGSLPTEPKEGMKVLFRSYMINEPDNYYVAELIKSRNGSWEAKIIDPLYPFRSSWNDYDGLFHRITRDFFYYVDHNDIEYWKD